MSIFVLRTCLTGGEIAWNASSYWQHNSRKLQQLRTQLPYNLRKSFNTSKWNQSRWPGKRHFINTTEDQCQNDYALGRLWRPFVFSISVSGVSIAGAAIWQYENVRSQALLSKKWWENVHTPKYGQFRQHMNSWWNKLSSADKTFVPICFLNILVYLAWRVPAYHTFMTRYFMAGLTTSNALCWPMLLSVFSHYNLLHLAANMFVLHSFSDKAVSALGREQFVAFYLSAGLMSSFTSYLFKAITKSPSRSLGASGAVMGVLAYVCSKYPNSQLAIILLPQFPFEAGTGFKALLCLDTVGCILRWSFFDHAAHLGGSLFGMAWFYYGHQYIWRKREPLISAWHRMRGAVK